MIANDSFRLVLPAERLEERAEKVVDAFEAMRRAREEKEDQRVIDSQLDVEAVEGFKQKVRETWEAHRLVAPALDAAGSYDVVDGEPEEGTKFGIPRQWIFKGMFIADPRILGADWLATDIGRNLAGSELLPIAQAALESVEFAGEEGESLAQVLRRAIAEVADHGEHLIVLVPINWQLAQTLEVAHSRQRGGEAEAPEWIPDEEIRNSFIGTVEGVPVIDVLEMPEDRIAVVALDRFLRWRQWRLDGHEVTVELTAFSEEEARALAEEHDDLFRTEERTTVEARSRELRKSMLLDVFERFRVEQEDPEAGRWLAVPQKLREP